MDRLAFIPLKYPFIVVRMAVFKLYPSSDSLVLMSSAVTYIGNRCELQEDLPHLRAGLTVMRRLRRQLVAEYGYPVIAVETSMATCVEGGGLAFQIKKPYTLEQAQRLAIQYAEKMVHAFNSDLVVRPYLIRYPFTVENISVGLIFKPPKRRIFAYPYVTALLVSDGIFLGWYSEPANPQVRTEIPPEAYDDVRRRLSRCSKKPV
jgi:hypothetical protein